MTSVGINGILNRILFFAVNGPDLCVRVESSNDKYVLEPFKSIVLIDEYIGGFWNMKKKTYSRSGAFNPASLCEWFHYNY